MVVPCFQMPALRIEAEPVERAVGQIKITRGVQGAVGGQAVQHIQHAGMAHHRDGLPRVLRQQLRHCSLHPRGQLLQALPRGEVIVQITRLVARIGGGVARGGLRPGEPLEFAEVALAQQRCGVHVEAAPGGQALRGFHGALQVAAADGRECVLRRVGSHHAGLVAAMLIERDVGLSLDAFLGIPGGLAVADEADACGHVVSVGWVGAGPEPGPDMLRYCL